MNFNLLPFFTPVSSILIIFYALKCLSCRKIVNKKDLYNTYKQVIL